MQQDNTWKKPQFVVDLVSIARPSNYRKTIIKAVTLLFKAYLDLRENESQIYIYIYMRSV